MFRNPTTDLIVVLVIVLLIFGPKRLPGLGKQLGTGIREFKDSITGDDESKQAERPELTHGSSTPLASSDAASPSAQPTAAAPPAGAAGRSTGDSAEHHS
jgi:sec-independent protein translocase protein TatA